MNKLWFRMALSYVLVFTFAIFIPIISFGVLDALNVIEIEELMDARNIDENIEQERTMFLQQFPRALISFLVFSSIIGIGAGALVSRQVAKPIAQMAEAARRIGEKDFETQLEIKGSEEINSLADAFNQMVSRLGEAEKLRQNLLADVSHELRTPLTVLEGQLRAALDNVIELGGEDLANLYNQTHYLIRLVNELHELAQVEAQKLPLEILPADINLLLKEVADVFKPLAEEKGVHLSLHFTADLPQVLIDSYRIRQSLHNLLANSLLHTPESGSIYLGTYRKEQSIVIEIKDTGEGIEKEHLPHLFDRFYRVDSSRSRDTGGTGLGLAIVKAIVEAQGGQVEAISEGVGKGSNFSISLPTI